MKKFGKIFVLSIALTTVGACNGGDADIKVESLYTGLLALNKTKNYTIERYLNGGKLPSIYFNESFVGSDTNDGYGLDVYIQDKIGIYSLNYDDAYLPGEYVCDDEGNKYTSLWDNKFVSTMYNVENDYVGSIRTNLNSINVGSKAYKIAFLKTVGIDPNSYVNMDSFVASYADNIFKFEVSFYNGNYQYSYEFTNFGITTNKHVDEFLSRGGTAYFATPEQLEFRRLMCLDNFVQLVYDFEIEGYRYAEHFTPGYFFTMTMGPDGWISSVYGYMAMNHKAIDDQDMDLYGCYYFYTESGQPHFSPTQMYTKPDITEFFHYPKYMELMHKLQFLKTGALDNVIYEYEDSVKFYVDNDALIRDFAINFSIDQSFDFETYAPYGLAIELELDKEDQSESMIVFHYLLVWQGQVYDYPIPFGNFGKANDKGLDSIYEYYNNVN